MRVTGPDVGNRGERTGVEALTENVVVAGRVVVTVAAAAPDAALYEIWNIAVSEVGVATHCGRGCQDYSWRARRQ